MSKQENHLVAGRSVTDLAMKYVSDNQYRQPLYDLVEGETENLRLALLEQSCLAEASNNGAFSPEMLEKSKALVRDIGIIVAVIAFRGEGEHHKEIIGLPFSRLMETFLNDNPGFVPMKHWYPICLLFYLAGVGALAGKNYAMLAALFHAPIRHGHSERQSREKTVLEMIGEGVDQLDEVVKFCDDGPSYGRWIKNKHFFEVLPYILYDADVGLQGDERLFTNLFERLGMFQEIRYYQLTQDLNERGIRFAGRYSNKDPMFIKDRFLELAEDAGRGGEGWLPLKSGMFEGNAEDVVRIVGKLVARLDAKGFRSSI